MTVNQQLVRAAENIKHSDTQRLINNYQIAVKLYNKYQSEQWRVEAEKHQNKLSQFVENNKEIKENPKLLVDNMLLSDMIKE